MGIKALLIGIAVFESGMLYWLLCGTVLEKEYFRKKDWVILYVSIVGNGINILKIRSIYLRIQQWNVYSFYVLGLSLRAVYIRSSDRNLIKHIYVNFRVYCWSL